MAKAFVSFLQTLTAINGTVYVERAHSLRHHVGKVKDKVNRACCNEVVKCWKENEPSTMICAAAGKGAAHLLSLSLFALCAFYPWLHSATYSQAKVEANMARQVQDTTHQSTF